MQPTFALYQAQLSKDASWKIEVDAHAPLGKRSNSTSFPFTTAKRRHTVCLARIHACQAAKTA